MLKPGMLISDRYEIVDKVGTGGMADVYKARCHRLNRFVAIKVLKPEYSNDKSFVNKFRGEAQSAAGLSHPNIVNVYDVGDDGGLHYIVMELVEGITLKKFIERKGKLEVKEAVGIAIQIAQGVEAAHGNHIIHRDIKPQNIIISRDGKVKVTDFGIAKATTSNTITSNAMGSVHYLSPEQARGGYSDEKSDIYSLGVTIYEMLAGKVPFAGDNTVSVALLHIQGEAIPLRELDPVIPVSVDKIVQKCMQKRAERRYHTATDLIADLKKAIANPDGDFVQIPAFVASDSPTINISDELNKIKNGAFLDDDMNDPIQDTTGDFMEEDDEDLDTVDSKVERYFVIGSIAAAVVLGIVIFFLVLWFVFPNKPDKQGGIEDVTPTPTTAPEVTITITPTPEVIEGMYRVPAVLGLRKEDAEASIRLRSPNARIIFNEEYSDTAVKGYVIAQYPQADNEVKETQEVVLTISTGPQAFEIPDVYTLTEVQADKKLEEMGLILKHEYVESSEVEAGKVISTIPERHTFVYKGDKVTVIVSTGVKNKPVVVPNLIGLTEKNAIAALTSLGLKKGTISYEPSATYAKGLVTYQSNTAGQKVNEGSSVDIIVSTGPENQETIGQGTKKYKYIGELTININPFDYIDDDKAEIVLEMEQGGWLGIIYEEDLTETDFPLTIKGIEGENESVAIVRMYVNGVLFKLDGERDEMTWIVEFKAVEE